MDTGKSIQAYLEDLQSASPTPGGGNAAALCGALAAALGLMVSNLTIGKKKYAAVEAEMQAAREALLPYPAIFTKLGEEDNAAFDAVMGAFKLPKETEEEKAARSIAIANATVGAARVPASVLGACAEVLPHLQLLAEKGNQNSLSDAGVAAAVLSAAATGAYMNVLINCGSLPGNAEAAALRATSKATLQKLRADAAAITLLIEKGLSENA